METIEGSALELLAKGIGYVPIKIWFDNCFCKTTYWKKKTFFLSAFPPVTKLILLHTVVVLHYTHNIKMPYLVKGGEAVKMLKINLFLKL